MPLTPEDVSNKRFTPVRLREGYDMGEVDQFLDEVEAELERLNKENEELRAKLASVQSGAPAPVEAPRAPEPVKPAVPEPTQPPPPPVAAPVVAAKAEPVPVVTQPTEGGPDTYNQAAKLLEIATQSANDLVENAKNDADKIIGEARAKAERYESEAKTKADRMEADARTRAQMLDSETAERRQQMFGDLEKDRDKLSGEVETLRSFEREYRSRLKTYFTQQLEALGGSSEVPSVGEEPPAPKRLRSILGEDEA